MGKVRVPLHGKAQGFATLDTEATKGATVGVNLFWPDGSVVKEADFGGSAEEAGTHGRTLWSLVLQIPANVQAVAEIESAGFVRRDGAGAWTASPIVNADLSGCNTSGLTEGSNLYFTDERAQDAVGAAIAAGTGDGVTLAYDDANGKINATNTDKGTVARTAHEAAVDPHPQYTTTAEAQTIADAKVASTIAAGDSTHAPSGGAIFAALAEKLGVGYLNGREASDLNALDGVGVRLDYTPNTALNKPPGVDHAVLTINYTTDYSVQLAFDWRTKDIYVRNQEAGVWDAAFAKVWNSENMPDSGWQAPTLLNSWTNYGAPYATVGYRKIGSVVYLRGVIKGGTTVNGDALFNVPAGYRPPAATVFPLSNPNSPVTDTRAEMSPAGDLTVAGSVSNTYLCLDGITYLVD